MTELSSGALNSSDVAIPPQRAIDLHKPLQVEDERKRSPDSRHLRHNAAPSGVGENVGVVPPDSLEWTVRQPGGRGKMLPGSELVEDSYASDGTTTSDGGSELLSRRTMVTAGSRHRTRGGGEDGKVTESTSFDNESLKTPDSLLTTELLDDSVFDGELDWIDSRPSSAADKMVSDRLHSACVDSPALWSTVSIGDKEYKIDLKVIEPYKRVVSHGGYYGDGYNTIIVITACYLPDNRRRDYHYVMRNLFLYVISTLELLVTDDYVIIYFHGAAPRNKMPSFRWLRHCYGMIDRRYKKRLKQLLIVHPTFFLRTIVLMIRPFISAKFHSKLHYVQRLDQLRHLVPMDHVSVCEEVKRYDASRILQQQGKQTASS